MLAHAASVQTVLFTVPCRYSLSCVVESLYPALFCSCSMRLRDPIAHQRSCRLRIDPRLGVLGDTSTRHAVLACLERLRIEGSSIRVARPERHHCIHPSCIPLCVLPWTAGVTTHKMTPACTSIRKSSGASLQGASLLVKATLSLGWRHETLRGILSTFKPVAR